MAIDPPVSVSQIRAVLSDEPVTHRLSSGLNATDVIPAVCPCSTARTPPVTASQMRPLMSSEPVTRRLPSALTANAVTPFSCPFSTASSRPLTASQSRAVPSVELVAIRPPSAVMASPVRGPPWPASTAISRAVGTSQIRAVRSADAVTSRPPSGVNPIATSLSVCPASVWSSPPLTTFQSRAVLSKEPPEAVATRFPSGLNTTAETPLEWPSKTANGAPVAASHSRAVRSTDPVARSVPSGLNVMARISSECPLASVTSPVSGSQSSRRRSWQTTATRLASTFIASRVTANRLPDDLGGFQVATCSFIRLFQSRTVPSALSVTECVASALNNRMTTPLTGTAGSLPPGPPRGMVTAAGGSPGQDCESGRDIRKRAGVTGGKSARELINSPLRASHVRTVASAPRVITWLPSGLNETEPTPPT